MGVWTKDIFGNDLSCDVRDAYRERRKSGDDAPAAVKRVKREFAEPLRDSDDKWTIWIALAAIQIQAKEVTDDVRKQALQGIAKYEKSEEALELSPYSAQSLAAVRKRLGGLPAKSVKKHAAQAAPGNKGDVLAVKLPNSKREGVIVIGGPSGHDRGPEYSRVVLLPDLTPSKVTPKSVQQALTKWRHYRESWPNGLGRSIACYDVKGKLPMQRLRVLLHGIKFPPSFDRRMKGIGCIQRAADLPYVVENELADWKSRNWVIDPSDAD